MANTYKNIVVTPARSSDTIDPKIVLSGANTTTNTDITITVTPASNGTVSFSGSVGSLLTITNDLSNVVSGVYDISGIPLTEWYANGLIQVAQTGAGPVKVGNATNYVILTSNQVCLNSTGAANGSMLCIGNSTVNVQVTPTGITFNDNSAGRGVLSQTWDESAMGVIAALARGWALP